MHDWLVLALAGSAPLFIDIASYGIKEWLAIVASLIGIAGSIFGLWRGWRYSKSQIVERLLEHLRDEETKIKEARDRIIQNLRRGVQLDDEPDHEFYREVKEALRESGKGDPRRADQKLETLAENLRA